MDNLIFNIGIGLIVAYVVFGCVLAEVNRYRKRKYGCSVCGYRKYFAGWPRACGSVLCTASRGNNEGRVCSAWYYAKDKVEKEKKAARDKSVFMNKRTEEIGNLIIRCDLRDATASDFDRIASYLRDHARMLTQNDMEHARLEEALAKLESIENGEQDALVEKIKAKVDELSAKDLSDIYGCKAYDTIAEVKLLFADYFRKPNQTKEK